MLSRLCRVFITVLVTACLAIAVAGDNQQALVKAELLSQVTLEQNLVIEFEFNTLLPSLAERGARFNHPQQLIIEYLFIALIGFFASLTIIKYLHNFPLPPPWYEKTNLGSADGRISGWKDSNLLYKAKLSYHH